MEVHVHQLGLKVAPVQFHSNQKILDSSLVLAATSPVVVIGLKHQIVTIVVSYQLSQYTTLLHLSLEAEKDLIGEGQNF